MHKFKVIVIACAALMCATLPATASVARALAIAERYAAALSSGDCAAALEDTSPALRKRLGRDPQNEKLFCEFVQLAGRDEVHQSLDQRFTSLTNGKYGIVLVTVARATLPDAQHLSLLEKTASTRSTLRAVTRSTLVLHTSDSGATWHVLDMACTDKKWIQEIYPPYNGRPSIRPATLAIENWPK